MFSNNNYFVFVVENSFVQLYDCNCIGQTQVYQCTVSGGGITVWQGSAFECPELHNQIRLRHSEYLSMNSQATGVCNDGAISASSIGVSANHYISMLNVTVREEMINGTVECVHYDTKRQETQVGQEVFIECMYMLSFIKNIVS